MKLLIKEAVFKSTFWAKTLLFCLAFTCIHNTAWSQDVYLTQFNYSPLLLNAANTGSFYGDWRAALNYRNQWSATGTPYTTAVVSGDKQFSVLNQSIGAGLLFVSDQSYGITRNKLYASGSYFYQLNENRFSAGLQAGMVFNSPTVNNWKGYNENTGLHDGDNGEGVDAEKSAYADINLGLLWKRDISIFEPELGVSFAHLNMPNQSFMNGEEKVTLTSTIHASIKTKLNDAIYLFPTLLLANGNGNSVSVVGCDLGYNLLGNRSSVKRVFIGGYVRNGIVEDLTDFSVLIGTTVGRLDIALNYDANLTGLSESKNISTFEISLLYKSISTVLNSYSIPCERF